MLKAICIALHLCSTLLGQAYVLDGDTISIDGFHIRLNGIDAEELNEPHGLSAKNTLTALIAKHTVICKLNGDRSYKRYVGSCFIDGRDLAMEMVELGQALDCAHYSHGKYRRYEPNGIRFNLIQKPYC